MELVFQKILLPQPRQSRRDHVASRLVTTADDPLTWQELRFLQLIYEPFALGGAWPVFQYLRALAWQELRDINGDPIDPRDVFLRLAERGLVRPPLQRDHAFSLRDETTVAVSLTGLANLREAGSDLGHLISAIRHIADRAHDFRPSDPQSVEQLRITDEEIRLALDIERGDRALLRLAALLRDEASDVWATFSGPDPGSGWSLGVDLEAARRYRNVLTVGDIVRVGRRELDATTRASATASAVEHPSVRTSQSEGPRLFISYSHRDQQFVLALVEELRSRGASIWIDQVDLVVGDSLIQRIGSAIEEGDFVVAVISSSSIESPWCQKELSLAVTHGVNEKRVNVLPIRLEEVAMPAFLQDVLYAAGDDVTQIADDLWRAVIAHLEREGRAAPDRLAPTMADDHPQREPFELDTPARTATMETLTRVGEQVDELLIQWDKCQAGRALGEDITAEQRRLRTLLDRLPEQIARAVPLIATLATESWQEYFRVRASSEVEPQVREELRSVMSQLDRRLPITPRWIIESGPSAFGAHTRDAVAFEFQLRRERERRSMVVFISRTAVASSDSALPTDVVEAKRTEGQSVAIGLLGLDEPPSEVEVSSVGISWSTEVLKQQ